MFAGNAFASEPVCHYAAGETLLTGPITSLSFGGCETEYRIYAECKCRTTTQLFACSDANGRVTRSGVLTVIKTEGFVQFGARAEGRHSAWTSF